MVRWPVGPAALHERALVGLEAVIADRDVGKGAREGCDLRGDRIGHFGEERLDPGRDVPPHEWGAVAF